MAYKHYSLCSIDPANFNVNNYIENGLKFNQFIVELVDIYLVGHKYSLCRKTFSVFSHVCKWILA